MELHMRIFLTLFCVAVVGCGGTKEESGTEALPDFSEALGVEISDLTSVDGPSVDAATVRNLIPEASSGIDGMQVYTATATDDDESFQVRIASVDISDQLPGTTMLVVLGEGGTLNDVVLDGVVDSTGYWANFQSQFGYKGKRSTLPADPMHSSDTALSRLSELQASADAGDQLIVMAYQHQRFMRDYTQLTRVKAEPLPSGDWFREYNNRLDLQDNIVSAFEDAAGASAVQAYQRVTADARDLLGPIATQADNGNGTAVLASLRDFRRKTCGACHGIEEHNFDTTDLDDGLAAYFEEIGATRDYYVVGMDVWPVPGEEETSQNVANSLKASLMMLHQGG